MINKDKFLMFLYTCNVERDLCCDDCPVLGTKFCEAGATCCESLAEAIKAGVDNGIN